MMKTISLSLLMILSSITMTSLTGCGSDSKPASITEGVELSEIEAYEKAQREMEAESATGLEEASRP
ncbi:hypothetical protein [Novipirellula artificiosorum]|uniref:Secreted protein n=1 Tax=Novipirellula artificiosorum TaxID=2528016 RepID=A0A5C6E140_9BACT|nr:hypothetical protein [Novipirellula artificiosorum]TWU42580.1 hypothetical protein Poly41_08770 [Novipirellula artificiosorum]